jgi:hypothetical protein
MQHLFNAESSKSRSQLHDELRARILNDAGSDPEKILQLSVDDVALIASREVSDANGTGGSIGDFKKADTFLRGSSLTSRVFQVDGVGSFKGGEINYISVGVMFARHGYSVPTMYASTNAWNTGQLLMGDGIHNAWQNKQGRVWARFGYDYYRNGSAKVRQH